MTRSLLLFSTFALVAAHASVTNTSAEEGYKYVLNVKKDDVYKFKMLTGNPGVGEITMVILQEVKAVNEGKTTMESRFESVNFGGNMPDSILDMIMNIRATAVIDQNGRTLDMKVTGAQFGMDRMFSSPARRNLGTRRGVYGHED
jgi:hypothetical protein